MTKSRFVIQWLLEKLTAITYLCYFLLFYCSCFSTFSQNTTFSNVVLHSSDKTPVNDVNIYFEGTGVGTISNEDGKFELHYDSNKIYDYLIISKIGYGSLRLKFNEIPQDSPIYLSQETILLDEVIVIQNKVKHTAKEIVEIAFKNLSKNLSPNAYLSTGYIRHTERTKNQYRYLKEGIFTLYDKGFNAHPSEIGLNLNYSRNAIDTREIDTIRFYRVYLEASNLKSYSKNHKKALNYKTEEPTEIKKAIAFYDNHYTSGYHKKYGLLKKIFATDINKIRYFDRNKATFSKRNIADFSFKIDTVFGLENDLVYKIKFSKTGAKDEIDLGYLFINKENYAIVEVQHSNVLAKDHHFRKFSGESIRSATIIKYRKINGYYYPIYVSHKRAKFNNDLLKAYLEKNQGELNYYSHQEILLSDIITDKLTIEETKSKQKYWNDNLFQEGININGDWADKNFLLESSYEEKLREDLEKKFQKINEKSIR